MKDSTNVRIAKIAFRAKRGARSLRRRSGVWATAALHAFTIKRAIVIVPFAVIALIMVDITITTYGKVVLLPFEYRGDRTLPAAVLDSIASRVAARLNELNELFPSQRKAPKEENKLATADDVVQEFMSQLPLSQLPGAVRLTDHIALSSISVGGFSLPFKQLLVSDFGWFHKEVIKGTIDQWSKELSTEVDIGGKVTSTTLDSTQSLGDLADVIAIEIARRKHYIELGSDDDLAILEFTRGLRDYQRYVRTGAGTKLSSSRQHYEAALSHDRGFDLARLHLAVTQFDGNTPEILRASVQNFLLLIGSGDYAENAQVGYAAAIVRLLDSEESCAYVPELVDRVLDLVSGWKAPGTSDNLTFQQRLTYAQAFHSAGIRNLDGNTCAELLKSRTDHRDALVLLKESRLQYFTALRGSTSKTSEANAYTEELYIRFQLKTIRDEISDYEMDNNAKNSALSELEESAREGSVLVTKKKDLEPGSKRLFAPYLRGSLAETFLRRAYLDEGSKVDMVEAATKQLRRALEEGDPDVAAAAALRLAEIGFMKGNMGEGLGYLQQFAYAEQTSITSEAEALGRAVEGDAGVRSPEVSPAAEPSRRPLAAPPSPEAIERCQLRAVVRRALEVDDRNVLASMLLADLQSEDGQVEGAAKSLAAIKRLMRSNHFPYGPVLSLKAELIEARVAADHGQALDEAGLRTKIDKFSGAEAARNFLRWSLPQAAQDQKPASARAPLTNLGAGVGEGLKLSPASCRAH